MPKKKATVEVFKAERIDEKPKKPGKRGGKRPGTGGPRPGSGRKQTFETILTMKERREYFVKYFVASGKLEPILNNLFAAAMTNPKAAAYVLNQLIGSPIQGIELAAPGGGPMQFTNLSDDELRRIAAGNAGTSATGISPEASN